MRFIKLSEQSVESDKNRFGRTFIACLSQKRENMLKLGL